MAVNSAAIGRVIAHGASDAEAQAQAQAGGPTAARTAMLRGGPPDGSPTGGGAQGTGSSAAQSAASAPGGQAGRESSEGKGVLATVGAALGAVVSAEQSLSTLLSGIPMPAFPAARITDWAFGIPHAHSHPPNLIPPAPPIPLPATGPTIKIPYVSGADTVLINNLPAARCGDMGVNIWCGGYFPFYEIFLGSSSVWIEGARAARLGVDMTKHCIFSTPKPNDLPLGPMIGALVQGSPNVIIGGVPLPSLTNLAIGAALAVGIGKAIKAVRAIRAAAAAERAAKEAAEKAAKEAAEKAAKEAAEQAAKEAAEKAAKEQAALAEAAGSPQNPWMIRPGEGKLPPSAKVAKPGSPMRLDSSASKTYLYVVKEDGSIVYAPQKVVKDDLGREVETVKHTDLAEAGPARVSGEITHNDATGAWEMDSQSGRYSAAPIDPNNPNSLIVSTRSQQNVEAAAELARRSGTENKIIAKPPAED
jgi:uncharacterized Zn-binding protein involved in type VI secretion